MKRKTTAILLALTVVLCSFPIGEIFAGASTPSCGKPLEGKYLSIMGDSISTYMGWSDSKPITSEDCTNRYGEPYYGPTGSGCHNTELLVEDTWWHQAAQQLGAEILMSNAGNSTGLLHASYPNDADWELYLQELLAYKTRPYYMGADGITPDIIALYIGSSDVRFAPELFGTLEAVDFDTLIVENSDGSYTYAVPTTVAESYCILLHKIMVTYPAAEVYCFTVVPSAGGYLSTCNKRLTATVPYNQMIRSVAEHYGATVVDLFAEFGLDPDGDSQTTQELFDSFQTYYNADPHPNAAGFDVITKCFVDTVLANSKYVVSAETTAGNEEYIGVTVSSGPNGEQKTADDYVTPGGMTVDYRYVSVADGSCAEWYTSTNSNGTYKAQGGAEKNLVVTPPSLTLDIPLQDTDDKQTAADETQQSVTGRPAGKLEPDGSRDSGEAPGIYDYTEYEVVQPGHISVKTHSVSVSEHILPSSSRGMHFVRNTTYAAEGNDMVLGVPPVSIPQMKEDVPPIAPGFEYVYIDSDQISKYWAAYLYNEPDAGYPDEAPVYSDEQIGLYAGLDYSVFKKRKLLVPKLYLPHTTVTATDKNFPARYESIQQFTLCTDDCKIITAYCADQKTPALPSYSYRMINLEDANYYSAHNAGMIRTIANNGYWGTESGFGSLAAVKDMMTASGKFTEAEVARVTDGMAMTATQYAIWTHSNAMDSNVFINVYCANVDGVTPSVDVQAEAELVCKLYHHLISLSPTLPSEDVMTTRNVLINEQNFLKRISLKVNGKLPDEPANLDNDTTNDVYDVDIFFELAVQPSTTNGDDLVLQIQDESGSCIAVGRIAGEPHDGEVMVEQHKGKYVFRNVPLQEGIESASFVMTGTQRIDRTPHLLTSEVRDGVPSQTLVCVAKGERGVNVMLDISFELSADDEVLVTEHHWRTEKHIPNSPPTGDGSPVVHWIGNMVISSMAIVALVTYQQRTQYKPKRLKR